MSQPDHNLHPSARPLRRPRLGRVLAGVSGAIANRFGIDITTVRIAFVVLAVCGGAGIPLYLASWLLVPEEGAQLSIAEDVTRNLRWL